MLESNKWHVFPFAGAATAVIYNLPSPPIPIPTATATLQDKENFPPFPINDGPTLRLTRKALADIYSGTIRFWDDEAIRMINPNMTLPYEQIIPFHM